MRTIQVSGSRVCYTEYDAGSPRYMEDYVYAAVSVELEDKLVYGICITKYESGDMEMEIIHYNKLLIPIISPVPNISVLNSEEEYFQLMCSWDYDFDVDLVHSAQKLILDTIIDNKKYSRKVHVIEY